MSIYLRHVVLYKMRLPSKTTTHTPDSKVHGTIMGPTWGRQDPGGPHVGPMNVAIWVTIFGSDNGLPPGRRQAIIQTSDGILLIWPSGTSFNEISTEIITFSFEKICLKVSSAKWRPLCLGLNVLTSARYSYIKSSNATISSSLMCSYLSWLRRNTSGYGLASWILISTPKRLEEYYGQQWYITPKRHMNCYLSGSPVIALKEYLY